MNPEPPPPPAFVTGGTCSWGSRCSPTCSCPCDLDGSTVFQLVPDETPPEAGWAASSKPFVAEVASAAVGRAPAAAVAPSSAAVATLAVAGVASAVADEPFAVAAAASFVTSVVYSRLLTRC